MKLTHLFASATAMLALAAQAQITQPLFPPAKLAVLKCGTSDTNWPMVTSRVAPCFVQAFDPATLNQSSANPLISVALATNFNTPGSIWINHHAGSEGGGISRSVDRQFLALEGYSGQILTAQSSKPSTDNTVYRGVARLDAFGTAVDIYDSQTAWFGIPVGSPAGTQDNPTGICTPDGTNYYGTGNFAGTSQELDGTLFYGPFINGGNPVTVQNYLQAAGEARIINGTVYVAAKSATGVASGIYNFVDGISGAVVPRPWDPTANPPYFNFATTNLYINWGTTFKTILNFDMNPANTIAYGADQTFGIVKFTNNSGIWVPAYYYSATNLNTVAQTSANQGCFGICVDFSGPNAVIYATTMENGTTNTIPGGLGINTAAGHPNNNRIIKIVDTGVAPGTAVVAQTLAVAQTTNEFFGGIDFTPDLRPLITSQPANYSTVAGSGSPVPFSLTVQSAYAVSNQWFIVGTNSVYPNGGTNLLATEIGTNIVDLNADLPGGIDITYATNNYVFCIVTNNYGSVTSSPALLTVTVTAVKPTIIGGTNHLSSYIGSYVTLPAVHATGTQPFTTYQWYDKNGNALTDDGVKYLGSLTPSLTISNLLTPGDAGNYSLVISNAAGYASNIVDVLTVNYHPALIAAGTPILTNVTFVGTPITLATSQSGGTPTVTAQWFTSSKATSYTGVAMLTDNAEYVNSGTPSLTINAGTTADSTNYFVVYSNGAGSVTSAIAQVSVIIPPPNALLAYSNQVYLQTFDTMPDPGGGAVVSGLGVASQSGASVNSINNPQDPGTINGLGYSLANPFDFTYPVIPVGYIGGLNLTAMKGWYGAADTLANAVYTGLDGITRFGAQDGDQSTGGVIDYGLNDVNGGIVGTNRALGLQTTSTTGSTAFGLRITNSSPNTLNYINVGYIAELWRQNSGARTIQFGYYLDNTGTFALDTQSISNAATTLVPALNISFPTYVTVQNLDGTQPANQQNLSTNNLQLSTPWAPGTVLWLIWSMNYYGSGGGNGYAIDNFTFSASQAPITAPTVSVVSYQGGASGSGLKLAFSDAPGANLQFTVWGTTNLALPLNQWSNLGHPAEITSGSYQFTDAQATNKPARFYKVTSP